MAENKLPGSAASPRIVLAYDASLEGRNALREGALLAKRLGANVHLLSVIVLGAGTLIADAQHAGPADQISTEAAGHLTEAIELLRKAGLTVQGKLVQGEPVKEIAAYAAQTAADLVIVGHRRRSLIERWWAGSTDTYLLDHLTCSVMFVRRRISDEQFYEELFPEVEQ